MTELGAVTRVLLGITGEVNEVGGDRGLAALVCRACVDGLDVDGASISLLTGTESRETLWATDATAELLEDLQFSLNDGVCMQAAATGFPVLAPDLGHETERARWPIFAAAVVEQTDARALFALPLQWGALNLGVLDLYRTTAGGLPDEQWRDLRAVADTAALMMLGLYTDPGRGDPGLNEPGLNGPGSGDAGYAERVWLEYSQYSRAEIHQATGMVLAQLGISATNALARLRAHAFVEQRLLIDVARDVVARRLKFDPDL